MTLHWWMHWFWVTLLTLLVSRKCFAAPQAEELQRITSDTKSATAHTERQARAMYFSKPTSTTQTPLNVTEHEETGAAPLDILTHGNITNTSNDTVVPAITWTPVDSNATKTPVTETTALPERATESPAKPQNTTESNMTVESRKPNSTQSDFKDDSLEGLSESRIVTEKPLSLETSYLHTRVPASDPSVESFRRVDPEGGMDTGAIAGISFGALVLAALAGSTAFVLYRRRYLNKPETLNDKCSNPDSSGYLDDSTIRDNSEEMYSLDNDSFLNSLEAMTIQNYWTDTVKHTKL